MHWLVLSFLLWIALDLIARPPVVRPPLQVAYFVLLLPWIHLLLLLLLLVPLSWFACSKGSFRHQSTGPTKSSWWNGDVIAIVFALWNLVEWRKKCLLAPCFDGRFRRQTDFLRATDPDAGGLEITFETIHWFRVYSPQLVVSVWRSKVACASGLFSLVATTFLALTWRAQLSRGEFLQRRSRAKPSPISAPWISCDGASLVLVAGMQTGSKSCREATSFSTC
mmetsp:Transcript_24912/g.58032  ORF Transcript_24912/g.58032 Transcript_24912/m.58032 type:complete len:223 (+) Transcript_24912:493-1161(+)